LFLHLFSWTTDSTPASAIRFVPSGSCHTRATRVAAKPGNRGHYIQLRGALNTSQSAVAAMRGAEGGVLIFRVNNLALAPEAMSAALSIGKGAQLNLALSLDRELEDTPMNVGVVTICGPIKSGTAYDPDRLADVYWELATQDPVHFERDRLVRATA
jgi:hypothetical protein